MPGGLGNPLTDAFTGLTNNFVDIGRGTNPLSQPQITDLLGFNIPGVPLISTRDYFLLQMESWLTSIPTQSQWIAIIDSYPAALNNTLLQNLERTDGARKGYNIDQAKTVLTSFPLQKVIGCVFAQGVDIPQEGFEVNNINIDNNRGFIQGVAAGDRYAYNQNRLTLTFLETNTSFIDFVIRPWVIMASHFGLVARPGDVPGSKDKLNMKSIITLMCYTRSYQNISQIPRKVFTFYNCVPHAIVDQPYTYDKDGIASYSTYWTYTNYTIQNSLYFPLPDIINRVQGIVNGSNIPQVSPLQNAAQNGTNIFNAAGFF